MSKKISDLPQAGSLNNGDLFALSQIDSQAQTGYASKKTQVSAVGVKILNDTEYPVLLETDDKTVIGAINELKDLVWTAMPRESVSGSVANFETDLALPIKSLEVDVNAVQENGTPTPASPIPISGWSAITLDVNGNTEVISLGGTYYGGHLTQDKAGHRQFVVTSKFATFTGANNENWNDYPAGNGFFINLINDHITESYGDGKCNILPTSKAFSALGIVFGINSSYIFLMQVKNSWNISTVNELRDFLSVNNLQVVYTLAEPIIIDLPDGEPITTLVGTNNIFADTGDTKAEYYESFAKYISKQQEEPETRTLASSPSLAKTVASLEDVQDDEKTENTEEIKTEGESDNER